MWKRIIAPMSVVVALWIASSGLTSYYITWLEESNLKALSESMATIKASAKLESRVWRLQALALIPGEMTVVEFRQKFADLTGEVRKLIEEAGKPPVTEPEEVSLTTIRQLFEHFYEHTRQRLKEIDEADSDLQLGDVESRQLARSLGEECRHLTLLNEELLTESNVERAEFMKLIRSVRIGALLIGPLLGALLGFWLARGLHRSVSQISVTLRDMAGQIEHEVGRFLLHPGDDLPAIQEQVDSVAIHIRRIMDELGSVRRQFLASERLAAVGELAAGVAHELRNPLTSVKLLIQMAAQRESGAPFSEKQLHVIQEEIARMENTIQGLLDFARPPKLRQVMHDLCDTVARAVRLTTGKARQQRVSMVVDLPDQHPWINGDPEQLHQVLVNLLLNGIESMPGGGTLEVSVGCPDRPGNTCRVVVKDSGPGVSEAVSKRIFEPFVTTKEHGTGLGLAISRRIVAEHGGSLEFRNCAQGGAEFTVELPRCADGALQGAATTPGGTVANIARERD